MRNILADWDSYASKSLTNFIRAHYFFTVWRNYKILLHGIPIVSGSLLELGSSTGQISLRLSKKYKLKPTLVDSSMYALKYAKNLFSHSKINLTVSCQNVLNLKLEKHFNIVHSHGLLEHFRKKAQKKIFYNHVKYLVPNGWIICWVPTPDIFYKINRSYLEHTSQWIFGYEEPLSYSEFVSLFINEKLLIRKIRHLPGWLGIIAQKSVY